MSAQPEALQAASTIASLPTHGYMVSAEMAASRVAEVFEQRRDLPGAIVTEGGRILGVLSRTGFIEQMCKPFYPDLFMNRPVRELLPKVESHTLRLPESTTTQAAAARALQRPAAHRYEPILIERHRAAPRLLDVHTLLLAQNRLLSVQIGATEDAVRHAREAEYKYRNIFENAVDGIFQSTPDGYYISANPALARIYGYDNPEHMMRSVTDIARQLYVDPNRRAQFVALLERDDTLTSFESEIIRGDGQRIWISENVRAIRDAQGKLRYYEGTVEDITERRRAEEALRLTQFTVDRAAQPVFWVDRGGKFLYVNDAACRMLGYTRVEMLSMRIHDLGPNFSDSYWQEHWEKLKRVGSFTFETQNRHKSGTLIAVEVSANYLVFNGREVNCAFVRDLTERRRQEVMRKAKEAAEAASEAKSAFLARMSHEIRTPLNGVIGMLDLMRGTRLDERQTKFLRIAQSSAEALLTLINDVLDFSKIEAGKIELSESSFSPASLVEDVVEMLAPSAQAKGLEMLSRLGPDLPPAVVGDAHRLRQVLVNLTGNAIKFTAAGSVELRLKLRDGRLWFGVLDTGIGIPADRMDRLFKSFSQIDASTTRRFGGTGLGLAICKQLVELMGGQIGVENRSTHGTLFWLTLPVRLPEGPAAAEDVFVPAALREARVLVVDPSEAHAEVIQSQVRQWGAGCETAATGRQAWDWLGEHRAQVVLLDVHMDDADWLAQRLRDRGGPSRPAVVGLVNLSIGLPPPRANAMGIGLQIDKPVRQSQLLDALVKLVAGRDAPGPSQPETTASPGRPLRIDGRPPRVLVAEDNPVNQMLTREILVGLGCDCQVADNGSDAVAAVGLSRYDLVLMDCQMPVMDGFAAAEAIRAAESESRSAAVPIVALTADAVAGVRERCLEVGMNDYLSKPINPRQLEEVVARWLSSGAAVRCANEKAPLDVEALRERCLGDASLVERALRAFAKHANQTLAQVQAAADEKDAPQLARHAHTFKGMAANLAAEGLRRQLLSLERAAREGQLGEVDAMVESIETEVNRCLQAIPHIIETTRAEALT